MDVAPGPRGKKRARNTRRKEQVKEFSASMAWVADDASLKELPEFTLCIDQGSVGWAAHFFCLYVLHMNL
eukprot:9502746-Lingulodinium_polyedra.AAC.1